MPWCELTMISGAWAAVEFFTVASPRSARLHQEVFVAGFLG